MSVISAMAICFLISFTVVYSGVLRNKMIISEDELMCYELKRNETLELCSIETAHKDQYLNDFCRKEQDYYGCLFSQMDKFCGDFCAHRMVKSVPLSLGKEATDMTVLDFFWHDYRYPNCPKLVKMWSRGSAPPLSIRTNTYALAALLWMVFWF
ncbi:hypothetical protein Ddc_16006 [Ditylenchus destructor]|nr:hypothetical protein Ddc_16006 [Ditylenchus destructor]